MCSGPYQRFGAAVLVSALSMVQAACGGASGTTSVASAAPTLQSIAVTPSTAKAPAGTTFALVATGRYSDSSTKALTAQVTWASTNADVATISNAAASAGVAAAAGPGSTTITASLGPISGTAALDVTASARAWTWVGGATLGNGAGSYGAPGLTASDNLPGARQGAVSWVDGSGNLWLFGGSGVDINGSSDYLNDLWKYDILAGAWAWMGGSNTVDAVGSYGTLGAADAGNVPGARVNAASWVDRSGKLWLFGGFGYGGDGSTGDLADLWMFDPASGYWTWAAGTAQRNASGVYGSRGAAAAGNHPGARYLASAWVDAAGVFWLFGGYGYDAGTSAVTLADLWRFDPVTHAWSWEGGANSGDSSSVYGTVGLFAMSNGPGARYLSSAWIDRSGSLWLFGGYGPDVNERFGFLADLWCYAPQTGQWAWQGGAQGGGTSTGVAGPGGRDNAAAWTDAGGTLWLFGGQGYDAAGTFGALNDLWAYDAAGKLWTLAAGSTLAQKTGTYGTLGVPAAGNSPGARYQAVTWTDSSGALWLFGGYGQDGSGNTGVLNDLWKY